MSADITIIVTCYNVANYLTKTLDSLVAQTIFNQLIIICIDDGSSDNTLEILKSYHNKYSNIQIHTQDNVGIAKTRNKGLSLVQTKYFTFLDGDDYVKADMYEQLYNSAINNNSQVTVCDFVWDFMNKPKKNYVYHEGPYQIHQDCILNIFATLWNKLYETSFIRQLNIQFPDGYRYEDASFLYKIAPYIERISFVSTPLIYYVQRDLSITHTFNEKVKDMVYVFKDLFNFYQNNQLLNKYSNELEYVFIRFFLGNSFLRTIQIKDKRQRQETLNLNWQILNTTFPNWKQNIYLKNKSLKNIYYRLINKHNYVYFAKLFILIRSIHEKI